MNKKLTLSLGTVAAIAAPVMAVVSCGNDNSSTGGGARTDVITVQAEKGWVTTYQTIINKFKTENAKLMADNGIKNIEILEAGSFDVPASIKTKGIYDEAAVADVFLVASDGMADMLGKKALKAFNTPDITTTPTTIRDTGADAWLQKMTGNADHFQEAALSAALTGFKNKKTYAVPQNVESMVAFHAQGATSTVPVTQFANMWMTAGYFNQVDSHGNVTFNLKSAISTDPANGKAKLNLDNGNLRTHLITGFTNIINVIKATQLAAGPFDIEMLNHVATKSEPAVQNYIKTHTTKLQLLDGPWNASKMDAIFGAGTKAVAGPSNWHQWGGGWDLAMNGRITDKEQTVAEKLIATLLNKTNARAIYEGCGKMSPTEEGKATITDPTYSKKDLPIAVYSTPSVDKATDSAFGNAWEPYALTVETFRVSDSAKNRPWNLQDASTISDVNAAAIIMADELIKRWTDAVELANQS